MNMHLHTVPSILAAACINARVQYSGCDMTIRTTPTQVRYCLRRQRSVRTSAQALLNTGWMDTQVIQVLKLLNYKVLMYLIPAKVNISNFAGVFRLKLFWEDVYTIGINGMPGNTELFYYFRHQHCLNTTMCKVSVSLSYLMVWPR